METKTVTLRLPQDVADYITKDGYSMTDGVKLIIATLQRHERYADMELRGKFTPNEWKFLADTLNGTVVLDDFRFNKHALIANNQDAQVFEHSADKWEVDLDELNAKCVGLTATQTEALYRRVENFWNHPEINLDEWANY